MVRALVGDSTMTSALPPLRRAPALAARAFGGFAFGAGALDLAAGFGAFFDFEAGASTPSPWAEGLGRLRFLRLLARHRPRSRTVCQADRPGKSLATKDGRDRMARRTHQIHRNLYRQAKPPRRSHATISSAATVGSSRSLPTVKSARA